MTDHPAGRPASISEQEPHCPADGGHALRPEHAGGHGPRYSVAALIVVAAAAVAFGWPTRSHGFLRGDDRDFALEHVFVNHPSIEHAWRMLTIVHGDLYQPVPMLTFQANYALAGPDAAGCFPVSPYPFHLTNIVLHAVNAVLACLLATRLARSKGVGLLTGLMFACHPFALEPVAWISGRMILLATTFSLLTLLICLGRREDGRGAWVWLAMVSWLLVLASKVLPTVPIAAAACDRHLHRRTPRRVWATYALLLALGCAATWFAARSTGMSELVEATQAESATSPVVRVLLAARYYLENYVWPSRLSPWSPPPKAVAFLSTEVMLALFEGAALTAALWLTRRWNRESFLGLSLLLILIAPFLAATTARRILTADRYMYLPIFGLHLAVAAAAGQMVGVLRQRPSGRRWAIAITVGSAVLLVAWMSTARRLAPVWSSTVEQARRASQVYPDDPDVWAELARAHLFAKEPDAALEVVAQARERWPHEPRLALQAGQALRAKGLLGEAEEELRIAAESLPDHLPAQYDYALVLYGLGRRDEARAVLAGVFAKYPGYLPAALALGRDYRDRGEFGKAIPAYERVIEINPYHRDGLFELALVFMQQQRWDQARRGLQRILEIEPNDQPAMLNLGVVLSHLGRREGALRLYERLIVIDASVVAARLNRAELLAAMGRTSEAEPEYRAALNLEPFNRDAAVGLHESLQRQGRFGELAAIWLPFVRADRPRSSSEAAATGPAPKTAASSPSRPAAVSEMSRDEARAWLAWAYLLAGKPDDARRLAAQVPEDCADRHFADWTTVFDALSRRDFERAAGWFGHRPPIEAVSIAQLDQARVIVLALSSLPADVRESPAGMYALARAMLFADDRPSTTAILERITKMPDAGRWAKLAGELDRAMGPVSEPKAGPREPEAKRSEPRPSASEPAEEPGWRP
jgi:tetratricopeptide (TPR) repeat protein